MCPASVPALHAPIYILAQDADWLVKRVDGECVLRSAVQPDNNVQLDLREVGGKTGSLVAHHCQAEPRSAGHIRHPLV